MLPDLKKLESTTRFRDRARMRSWQDIFSFCDLAYCLHWAIQEASRTNRGVTNIQAYVIIERRRALEWVLYGEDWDSVSLDT
jgi:hypothetical protein